MNFETSPFANETTISLSEFQEKFAIQVIELEEAEPFDISKHPTLLPIAHVFENIIDVGIELLEPLKEAYDAPCIWQVVGSEEDGYYFFSGIALLENTLGYFVTEEAVDCDYVVELDATEELVADEDEDSFVEDFNPDYDD